MPAARGMPRGKRGWTMPANGSSTGRSAVETAGCAVPPLFRTAWRCIVTRRRGPGTACSHGEHFPLPPDVLEPFVPNGGGQPKGLSKREQIAWQLRQDHPLQLEGVSLDADLGRAIGYELAHSASEIDADRSKALAFWSSRAEQLRDAQVAWASDADPRIRQL
eukprot:3870358-Pyramimonas_sp.AAC.1